MVSQLLSPSQPKNIGDLFVLAILGFHILSLFLLPASWRIPTFAIVYLFWRLSYNVGIGYLLYLQSNHNRLITWAKKSKIFVNPKTRQNPHPTIFRLLKRELETKLPRDYKFEDAPIEYNTWLLFRRVVDLILMCDFVSYCLFAIACAKKPDGETLVMTVARWSAGWLLVGFNLWVKLDAHRVVKDFAWYWGDFFFTMEGDLVFDGVFEMAPHRMYSIGYAGYYGISALSGSYNVLFISIVAHAMQFAFLQFVENPHIDKTYNQPPPRKQQDENDDPKENRATSINGGPSFASTERPSPIHNLLGIKNIDLFRVTDFSVLLLQFYMMFIIFWTPSTFVWKIFFLVHAAFWRIWYSVGTGLILRQQSSKKFWTRHFLKYGESTEEAWRQWKGLYHLAMTMTYASFIAAVWKVYTPPDDWNSRFVILKHVVGLSLIALQVWTAKSIYDSLGEFGWFFGDFFFDQGAKLTYGGIYRFLNNPEQLIGLAGVWGAALITGKTSIFCLAALSHGLSLGFHYFIERPHMQKLYGQRMRTDSGFAKVVKPFLPLSMQKFSMTRTLEDLADYMEEFIDAAGPKIAASVQNFRSSDPFHRIPFSRVETDMDGFDLNEYSLEILGYSSAGKSLSVPYGAPLKLRWTAPLHHSKKDWVGLYKVSHNPEPKVTAIGSQGRWIPTIPNHYDSPLFDAGCIRSDVSCEREEAGKIKYYFSGEMEFSGDKLWWESGTYQFRYHHNGMYNVMATSKVFEITIDKFDEENVEMDANGLFLGAVQEALLPVVQNCFDRDPNIAPNTVDETFGSLVDRKGKYSRRLVYAVLHKFGVEFDSEVVKMDGTVRNLAWRICTAKKVLVSTKKSTKMAHSLRDCRGSILNGAVIRKNDTDSLEIEGEQK